MAEERRFVSLCDPDLVRRLSLSMLGGAYSESEDEAAKEDDDFVFDIDPTVLVDTRNLIIDEPIAEGLNAVVYKGWLVFQLQNLVFLFLHVVWLIFFFFICILFLPSDSRVKHFINSFL